MTRPRRRAALAGFASRFSLFGLLAIVAGCRSGGPLGPPDSFLVYAPQLDAAGAPVRTASGLPVLAAVPVDDPRAEPLYKQFGVGFAAEVLRTDYLAKQLVRDADVGGHRFPDAARAAALEPTVLVLGGAPAEAGTPGAPGRGLGLKGLLGRTEEHRDVRWIAVDAYPDHDRALPQTLAGLLGRAAAWRVAGDDPAARTLVDGYGGALEVIAREWRSGEGPAGAIPGDAGSAAQRDLFAAVRENRYGLGAGGVPRSAQEILGDPGVTATVLYRLAQSKTVGRKIAPAEVYAPFVTDRIPPGVSPAAVLGPFRNFQAKLLSAWGRAVLEGRPPHDIADLIDAYGRALPAERSEVTRVFVITTFGATVKPGGVRPPERDPGTALPELTALAAEVAAGRRSFRAALAEDPPR
jgi:hypothetical protein